jgi:hypothetical protein
MKAFLAIMLMTIATNSMAGVSRTNCSNEIENTSFEFIKDGTRMVGLTVNVQGLDNITRKDFMYKSNEITSSGETIVFEKRGVSSAEIMIQKVSSTEKVAMLEVQYKGQSQTILMKCK